MSDIKSVLFVCTGNSCRSVIAEGLFKKFLSDRGCSYIKVQSCGIISFSGLSPTENTLKVMRNAGIDVSGHKSTPLTKELIDNSDLILAMEDIHIDEVIRISPESSKKVHLLLKFAKNESANGDFSVLDPIGKPLEVYERVSELIKGAVEKVADEICGGGAKE